MHDDFEQELHRLTLNAIHLGRTFAEQWQRFGPLGTGVSRQAIPRSLENLLEGQVFKNEDRDVIDMMGDEIRKELNDIKPGYGDGAMLRDTSEDFWSCDRMAELSHLIEIFKTFRRALRDARDHVLAAQSAEKLLEEH